MQKRQGFTRGLAIVGTVLLWLPVILIVVLAVGGAPKEVGWLPFFAVGAMDIFPVVVFGGGFVLWAAIRARSHREALGWSLTAPVGSIVCGVVWSQPVPSDGWVLAVTTGLIALYWAGLLIAGASGISLVGSLVSRASS